MSRSKTIYNNIVHLQSQFRGIDVLCASQQEYHQHLPVDDSIKALLRRMEQPNYRLDNRIQTEPGRGKTGTSALDVHFIQYTSVWLFCMQSTIYTRATCYQQRHRLASQKIYPKETQKLMRIHFLVQNNAVLVLERSQPKSDINGGYCQIITNESLGYPYSFQTTPNNLRSSRDRNQVIDYNVLLCIRCCLYPECLSFVWLFYIILCKWLPPFYPEAWIRFHNILDLNIHR